LGLEERERRPGEGGSRENSEKNAPEVRGKRNF